MKPSNEPKADQLVNSNMPQADTGVPPANGGGPQFDSQVQAALTEADKAMGVGNGSAPGG
jgi:predicted RNase H-like nuclease